MHAQVVECQRHYVRSRHQLTPFQRMELCVAESIASSGRNFVARRIGLKLPRGSAVVALHRRCKHPRGKLGKPNRADRLCLLTFTSREGLRAFAESAKE
jgi:hypothetical protein